MRLHEVGKGFKKLRKRRKIVGRGRGSGHGKTSGRGHKGQKARSGSKTYVGFEGGQMPLMRRIPKRGFNSKFKKSFQIVNLDMLGSFKEGAEVNPESLEKAGLIKHEGAPVKILGRGEAKNALNIKAHAFSKSALDKINKAGAKAEVIKSA